MTPSYALHLAEWARARGMDLARSSVKRVLVAGEPGGGEPAMRAKLEAGWGASVTEAMGIGDISVSLWGECEAKAGMHFSGRGFVHFELIDPETGAAKPIADGAEGELVLTHLVNRSAPLLRFRTRDHVRIGVGLCACGRTAPRVRCIGRTDDMLIVRGVNVFPSAVREVVNEFAPAVTGVIMIRPRAKGVRQEPPLPVSVEVAPGADVEGLAERIRARLRDKLLVTTEIELAAGGQPAAQRLQVQARRESMRRGAHGKAANPGSAPHHAGRRGPADLDRFLGGPARHALHLRAAQSRQRAARATSISIRATAG